MGLMRFQPLVFYPNATRPSRGRRLVATYPKDAESTFAFQVRVNGLPEVIRQFKLQSPDHKTEKRQVPKVWRFDFAWPAYSLIVEVQGGIWKRGGGAHSHPTDIIRNMHKQNDAALAGFTVLQFTPEQVNEGEAMAFLKRVLATKGWNA